MLSAQHDGSGSREYLVCGVEAKRESADSLALFENLWILMPREPIRDSADDQQGDLSEKIAYD